jgi:hypothetical protein
MESTYELYVMEGNEEEFWRIRPELDESQIELLNCYYITRRDGRRDERCSKESILNALSQCCYETDLAVKILQQLDDHYLHLCAEKLKRQAK